MNSRWARGFLIALIVAAPPIAAQQSYQRAPKEVRDVLDAPNLPLPIGGVGGGLVAAGPASHSLVLGWPLRYPPISDLAEPLLRLAGVRINPRNNAVHGSFYFVQYAVKRIPDGPEAVVSLPAGARVRWPRWNGAGTMFAFMNMTDSVVELWVCEASTPRARRIDGDQIQAIREPPTVEYAAEGGQKYAPLFPLGFPAFSEFALQIFRVPKGRGRLTLHGRYWQRRTMEVEDSAEPIRIVSPGFALEPAGAIRLAWSIPDGAEFRASAKCGEPPRKTSIMAKLHRCPERQTAINDDCVVVASRTADSAAGTLDLIGVSPGNYLLSTTLLIGTVDLGVPVVTPVSVVGGRESDAVAAFSIRPIAGRVTRAGTAVEGIVEFPDGATTTDADGRYRIFLSRDQPRARISVTQCEPQRMFMTMARDGIALGTNFDIDLPDSELHVRVVDINSKQPLLAAEVRYALVRGENSTEAWGVSAPEVTRNAGGVSFLSVPIDEWLIVCSNKAEYKPSCSRALKLKGNRAEVVLPLNRTRGRGTLVASPVPRGGRIVWTNGLGDITEEVLVEVDGTFSFDRPHSANEHVILVSQDQPLYVLQSPPATDDGLTITLPRATTRDITVRYASEAEGVVRMKIGGAIVPSDVLVAHQNLRGFGWTVSRQAPLRIPQIAEVEAIEVAVVPESVFNQDPGAFEHLASGFAFKVVPRDGVVHIP